MPRKNRAKFKYNNSNRGPSNSSSVVIRNPFTNEGANVSETLRYLNDAFGGKVDGDAIFSIFSACDFNVNETIEVLFSVSSEASSNEDLQESMIRSAHSGASEDLQECQESESTSVHLQHQYHCNSTPGNHGISENYSDVNRRLFSLSLEHSSVNDPTVIAPLNQSEILHNRNRDAAQHQDFNESLSGGNSVLNPNSVHSLNYDAENTSAAVGVTGRQPCYSWYPPSSFSYDVPSCSPLLRSVASSCPEKESKIFFPHLGAPVERLDQNGMPIFYNQYQPSSTFDHNQSQSPPKFITPLGPSYRSKVVNYLSFKNEGSSTLNKDSPVETDPRRETMIKQIIEKVVVHCRVLIILRGLPGSGKSSLALKLKHSGVIYSTDDFFYKRGKYCFKWAKLSEAHEWNRRRTRKAMQKGITPVIIDNTNVERWEIKPYIALGLQFKYDIHILEPDTPWKFKPGELAKRNRHKVSKEKIERMLERYEHNITVESLVESARGPVTSGSSGLEDSPGDALQNEDANSGPEVQKREWFCDAQQINASGKEFPETAGKQINGVLQLPGENSVLLEAVVHREDETPSSNSGICDSIEHSSSSCDISANELCSNNSASSEIAPMSAEAGSENGQNGSIEGLDEIQNCMCLNDLIILTEQGSEECQTSSNQISPSCSSHDSSNWEVITNQDDFTWTSNPQAEVKEPDITYSAENNVNNSEGEVIKDVVNDQVSSEMSEKIYISLGSIASSCDTMQNETGVVEDSAKFDSEWGIETSGNLFAPKSQRETLSLPQRKTCSSSYPSSSNYSLFKKHRTCAEWGSIAEEEENGNWNDDSVSTKPKSEISAADVVPKPQRNLLPTVGISGISTSEISFVKNLKRESPQSNSLETVPENEEPSEESKPSVGTKVVSPNSRRKRKHDGLLQSLSPNCMAIEWEFPDFVLEPPHLPAIETAKKYNITCSSTQTDPHDFIFLHSGSHDDLQIEGFKILSPSPLDEQLSKSLRKPVPEEYSGTSFPKVPRFDKSTSMCDILESVETHVKLCILKDCFPDILYEDLKAHLEMFQGDTEWLTNILLDWGYKYNVDNKSGVLVRSKHELEETSVLETTVEKENNLVMLGEKNSTVLKAVNDNSDSKGFSVHDCFKADLSPGSYNIVAEPGNTSLHDTTLNDITFNSFPSDQPGKKQDSQNPPSASQTLQLRLEPAFILQLEECFGSVQQGALSMSLDDDSCVIEIDMKLAWEIHRRWRKTMEKSSTPKSDNKEVFDEGADGGSMTCDLLNISEAGSDDTRIPEEQPRPEGMSFAEIMDHEYALLISEKERLKSQKRKNSVGTRLKRDKLYKTFPGIDRRALDEVFEANKFSLRNTMIALEVDVGKASSESTEMDCDLCDISREGVGAAAVVTSPETIADFASENWNDWVEPSERLEEQGSVGLDSFSLDAASLREEAGHHHALHRRFMESAQKAFHDGKKQVAAYYRQKSHYHLEKFKAHNKEAVEIIVEENRLQTPSPLVLDLHRLYVAEAIHVLEKFIKSRRTEYFNSTDTDDLNISVITGHGSRSANGPKLRSSVAEYLKSKGFRFDYVNSGMFNVTVGQK